jgi:hypothetical protein
VDVVALDHHCLVVEVHDEHFQDDVVRFQGVMLLRSVAMVVLCGPVEHNNQIEAELRMDLML